MDELLNPIGGTGSNPNNDSPCLDIEFDRFSHPVEFPDYHNIEEYSKFVSKFENEAAVGSYESSSQNINQQDIDALKDIIVRDPLSEISEQEKELLWRLRHHCQTQPDSLPKLLEATKWNSRDDVSQVCIICS